MLTSPPTELRSFLCRNSKGRGGFAAQNLVVLLLTLKILLVTTLNALKSIFNEKKDAIKMYIAA